ncbi:MAG: HPF/RaiA family ribosome-associated protein [Acidobacteriota bacterium]
MRVELTGRHVVVSPGLRSLVARKFSKLERVLNDAGLSAAVVVTRERFSNVVEITLHARGEQFLHAVGKEKTWETAVRSAVAKLLHQAKTVKGRWHERQRRGAAARSAKVPKAIRPVRTRKAGRPAASAPDEAKRRVAARRPKSPAPRRTPRGRR